MPGVDIHFRPRAGRHCALVLPCGRISSVLWRMSGFRTIGNSRTDSCVSLILERPPRMSEQTGITIPMVKTSPNGIGAPSRLRSNQQPLSALHAKEETVHAATKNDLRKQGSCRVCLVGKRSVAVAISSSRATRSRYAGGIDLPDRRTVTVAMPSRGGPAGAMVMMVRADERSRMAGDTAT